MAPIRLQHIREAVQNHLERKQRKQESDEHYTIAFAQPLFIHSGHRPIVSSTKHFHRLLYSSPNSAYNADDCSSRFTARVLPDSCSCTIYLHIFSATSPRLQYITASVHTIHTFARPLAHRCTASCTRIKLLLSDGSLEYLWEPKRIEFVSHIFVSRSLSRSCSNAKMYDRCVPSSFALVVPLLRCMNPYMYICTSAPEQIHVHNSFP